MPGPWIPPLLRLVALLNSNVRATWQTDDRTPAPNAQNRNAGKPIFMFPVTKGVAKASGRSTRSEPKRIRGESKVIHEDLITSEGSGY